ncbi:MAG TPA: GxxExxY protein [Verrucomicrobiae bacterium]|nr:GxxExxY protein [Verrucomicrobiae bacterium]
MPTDRHRWETNQITKAVIGAAYTVGNTLGSGFLEKVFENALAMEIRKTGLQIVQQHPINVKYEGAIVGEFAADLLVQGEVLIELKAVKSLDEIHLAQCLNYLKATGLRVCLLINFGAPRVEIKRIML